MNTKTVHRFLCYLPYYFIAIIGISYCFADLTMDPPPPPPDGTKEDVFLFGFLMAKILFVHCSGYLAYCVISFPMVIIFTVHLCRLKEDRVKVLIHFSFYLVAIIATLFCTELYKFIS
ncbi:MAG: hypothetical protein V4677_17640 [Bacteroidota bacterium]